MILEAETLIKYGYLAMDLKPYSNKPILAACDGCEKVRETCKNSYHSLCVSCAEKGNTRRLGIVNTEEAKAKISVTLKGRKLSDQTKAKLSASHIGILAGDKNPNWQGGISFEPYCIKFNKEYKEHIRDLFGNECFLCGLSEADNGKALSVHHPHYNKQCGCDGTVCMCASLCIKCHAKTNSNRDYYEALITEMLKPIEAWM